MRKRRALLPFSYEILKEKLDLLDWDILSVEQTAEDRMNGIVRVIIGGDDLPPCPEGSSPLVLNYNNLKRGLRRKKDGEG